MPGTPEAQENQATPTDAAILRQRVQVAEAERDLALRLAEHLAFEVLPADWQPSQDCELTGFTKEGRCIEPAVAIRWENGFADQVCETHATRAEARGALVVRPRRADGTATPLRARQAGAIVDGAATKDAAAHG